jgi:hypothetical protein
MNEHLRARCGTDSSRTLTITRENVSPGSGTTRCEADYRSSADGTEDSRGYVFVRLEDWHGETDCTLVGLQCR